MAEPDTLHAIIGTAGHIDHGKTALVRALTGVDTDRLKEEKARGISIDLGFAALVVGDRRVGVVDVPGHERFIRNMLAGAHAIDLVLFTVAADDGVMPQTEEHLDIVHLLGVERGVVAVTKADLVTPSRLAEARAEIEILLAGTRLEGAPIVSVSSVTGAGLPELRHAIETELAALRPPSCSGLFRLPVDRAFLLKGHGMVVTGTALAGEVVAGAEVRILPGDARARVRSIEVHGTSVERAGRRQRVALNLVGAERATVGRGHVVCDPGLTLVTDRFDAYVELRPAARGGLRDHARVRVHIGTAERLGKLMLLDGVRALAPKARAHAQIALDAPVVALRGDRFILRAENARLTMGGGEVVLPVAERHRRRGAALVARLETVRSGPIAAAVAEALGLAQGFALAPRSLAESLDLDEAAVRTALAAAPAIVALSDGSEDVLTTATRWERVRNAIGAALGRFHAEHALAAGIEMEEVRRRLPYEVGAKLFRAVVERLVGEGIVERRDSLLAAPDHRVALAEGDRAVAEQACAALAAAGLAPPDLKTLAARIGVARRRLVDILGVCETRGDVVRVAPDLYYGTGAVAEARRALEHHLAERPAITAAEFRDRLDVSRKFSIALLDYFDRNGVTMRVGDVRKLRQGTVPG